MNTNAQNFIRLANFYNELATVMSAICVQKGGIAMENYVGRYFAADVLEYIVAYGAALDTTGHPELADAIAKLNTQFELVRDLVTPTQKPIHEMTMEEFEKVMNI